MVSSGSVSGLSAVAAPVFGWHGGIVASVGVAGPFSRIEEKSDQLIALIREAGERMSRSLAPQS